MYIFYCQVTFQKLLRRSFDREYSQTMVTASRLEFPGLRKARNRQNGRPHGPFDA
jgi:hypothetical protein